MIDAAMRTASFQVSINEDLPVPRDTGQIRSSKARTLEIVTEGTSVPTLEIGVLEISGASAPELACRLVVASRSSGDPRKSPAKEVEALVAW